jgi:hypothetical protein
MNYRNRNRNGQSGQIMVLFVIALVAMLAMAGLLFDGGQALALRRQLQDAGDAAALAAANVIQSGTPRGCSATAGPPPGSPRAVVVTAAQDAVHASLPNFPNANISVTCVADPTWSNFAVEVGLNGNSPGYFGGIAGIRGFAVRTTAQAINGQISASKYSVVELDPSNISWPNGYRGCPSVLFSGSNTVIFDGSMQVDSACSAANGGALSSNGTAATITFNNSSVINLVGGYAPGALTITPTPQTGQPVVQDPLRNLAPIPYSTWAASLTRATSQTTLSGGSTVLEPGIYVGGIKMRNSATAYMHPGIYVMTDAANGDGGFQISAGNSVYSLPSTLTGNTTSDANWATQCPVGTSSVPSTCGVLIYNVGMACASGSPKDQISVGAGATLKLRPYVSTSDGTGTNDPAYNNLLLWQDKNIGGLPYPTSSCSQPDVSLSGGGLVDITGGVYAPTAKVSMGGNSGGSGGSEVDLTLQFISWDLQFSGNIGFHFYYQNDKFPKPTDYGLIK